MKRGAVTTLVCALGVLLLAQSAGAALVGDGQEFPAFDIKNTYGKPDAKKLADLRGKVVIIDIWATWCGPCKVAIPKVAKLYEKYHDQGLEIISISVDDDNVAWRTFIPKNNMPWIHMRNGEFGWSIAGGGIPTIYVLGKDGKVLLSEVGVSSDMESKFGKVIEKALKVPGGDGTADPNSPELAAADKLRDQKKYAEAFDAYEALIRKHRTDDVGKAAKRHLDEMKKLPDVQELVKQRQATAESDRWLKFARQQRDAKQYDMARKYYQKIIDAYPGTDGAKTAEAELKALPAAQ